MDAYVLENRCECSIQLLEKNSTPISVKSGGSYMFKSPQEYYQHQKAVSALVAEGKCAIRTINDKQAAKLSREFHEEAKHNKKSKEAHYGADVDIQEEDRKSRSIEVRTTKTEEAETATRGRKPLTVESVTAKIKSLKTELKAASADEKQLISGKLQKYEDKLASLKAK